VGPAFFTPEMTSILPAPYNGAAAQLILKRYFLLQHWCGAIAILHLFAEYLYAGRAIERFWLTLLVLLFAAGLVGGFWLQPKLHQLHIAKYRGATVELREEAGQAFGTWHGVSMVINVLMLPGLLFYFWKISSPNRPSPLPAYRPGWT
jgi:hypothetical protein